MYEWEMSNYFNECIYTRLPSGMNNMYIFGHTSLLAMSTKSVNSDRLMCIVTSVIGHCTFSTLQSIHSKLSTMCKTSIIIIIWSLVIYAGRINHYSSSQPTSLSINVEANGRDFNWYFLVSTKKCYIRKMYCSPINV